MTTHDRADATKQDLKELSLTLRAEILHLHDAILLMSKSMATKDDIAASENRMMVLLESLRHDFIDGAADQLRLHAEQIRELQLHTGLRAA